MKTILKTAVAGIRLLCEVAINWIDEKRSVENIVSGLEELKEHVHIYAAVSIFLAASNAS